MQAFDAMCVSTQGGLAQGVNIRVWDHAVVTGACSSTKCTGKPSRNIAKAALPVDTDEDVFSKIVYGASHHDVCAVWVQGRLVSGKPPPLAAV